MVKRSLHTSQYAVGLVNLVNFCGSFEKQNRLETETIICTQAWLLFVVFWDGVITVLNIPVWMVFDAR